MFLTSPLVKTRTRDLNAKKIGKRVSRVRSSSLKRMDTATIASKLQLQEQRRELIFSLLGLVMKLGLLSLISVSLLKLCLAYHQRLDRHGEISVVLNQESDRLNAFRKRFDKLFTIGGHRRFLDEQDQWIEQDRLRVVWR